MTEAPGIVSTLNINDMHSFGIRTIKEAVSFLPGVIVQYSSLGATTIMVRGLSEQFNQKVLFLVDGIPYWMPTHGEIPTLGFPIVAVETIENGSITNGPGRVAILDVKYRL